MGAAAGVAVVSGIMAVLILVKFCRVCAYSIILSLPSAARSIILPLPSAMDLYFSAFFVFCFSAFWVLNARGYICPALVFRARC